MACHRRHVDIPLRAVPSHGKPRDRSQANARPGADVRLFAPETLRRQQATALGDRQQANGGQNEGEVREIQEPIGAGTDDHCDVLEPADPQVD